MTKAFLDGPIHIIKAYIASGVFPGASFAFVDKGKISKYTFGNEIKARKCEIKTGYGI